MDLYSFLLTKQSTQKRDQLCSDQDNTTTAHQLLNSLGFCTRVVVSITFHQVDYAPDTKTGTDCNDQCLKDIDCTAKKAIIKCMNKRFFLWSVSVWLYSFPFYSDLFVPLSVVAGCSNSFFHISPHLPQLQSLIRLLVLQLLHTFQILYLPTSSVGVPDTFRHQTHYSY